MKRCPICDMEFDRMPIVHSVSMEFLTAVHPLEGIVAWGVYDDGKVKLHELNGVVHWQWKGEDRLTKMIQYDHDLIWEAREYNRQNPKPCQHEDGCDKDGIPCYYEFLGVSADAWFCEEHAYDEGFCPSCGQFSAGFEEFDFSPVKLCGNCTAVLADEMEDDDDQDEWDEDYD